VAKTTRHNPDSQRGLTLVEEDFLDEFEDAVPPVPSAADLRATEPGPRTRAQSRTRRTLPPLPEEAGSEEEPFLRVRRRVPVRSGPLPSWTKHRWGKILLAALLLLTLSLGIFVIFAVHHFLDHDPRFQISSAASIQTAGNSELSRADLLSVFGSDIGRNIFFVPLGERAAQLQAIPWVKHATVMRVLPDQLRVSIVERKPVAFLRIGSSISLIDAEGVVLSMTPELMARHHFNFPVITGMDPGIPLAMRAQRMQLYQRFLSALAASGPHVTDQISEIDLADPEDVRATFSYGGHELLLHFGDTNFAARYHNYATHIQVWEQQYPKLASLDLRYDDQVVLRMATPPAAPAKSTAASMASSGAKKTSSRKAHRVIRHAHPTHHANRRAR
jgi:cell division protein FtsQ